VQEDNENMPMNDEWSGLADFLANMIAKYSGTLDVDSLPDPDSDCEQESREKPGIAIAAEIVAWYNNTRDDCPNSF
jgi:hypothetical protein